MKRLINSMSENVVRMLGKNYIKHKFYTTIKLPHIHKHTHTYTHTACTLNGK